LTSPPRRWVAALAVLAGLTPFAIVLARELAISQREWRAAQADAEVAERARELFQRGERDAAIAALAARLERSPDDADLRSLLGAWRLRLNDVAGARRELERVLARQPSHVGALNNLGLVAERERRSDEARRLWEAAIRLAPGRTRAHENLGNLELREGRWSAAVAQLHSAVQLDPGSAELHARLGVALLRSGDAAAARSELERALALDPQQPIARRNLASLEQEP
jgi:Flp pilus assembly protein TadD